MRRCIAVFCLLATACSNSATLPDDDAGEDAAADSAMMEDGGMTMDAAVDALVPEPPAPVCEGDTDPLDAVFEITTVDIPKKMDPLGIGGFNIDRLISTEFDVPGCAVIDEVGGVDNGFVYTAATIANFAPLIDPNLDLYAAVNDMIEAGLLTVSVNLQHWNGMADDEAVGVLITLESGGMTHESLGCGRMTGGILEGRFSLPVALALDTAGIHIALELRSPRIRIALSEDLQTLDTTRSYLGGYILWDDGTPVTLPGELRAQIENIIPDSISPALVKVALDSIVTDIDGYPELGICVEGNTQFGVSSDSLSIGLRLGGARVMQ